MTDIIPVILGIDVEPDAFEIPHGRPDPWLGFEAMVPRMRALRTRLERATGRPVTFTWWLRMDPQVTESYGTPGWVAEHYGKEFDELRAAGDELCLHPHAWRWDRRTRRWVTDHGDPDWVREVMEVSFDAYKEAFGEACLSHRFGAHFISPGIVEFLRERGVRWDTTVEPGRRRSTKVEGARFATGVSPDMTHAPEAPYHPDPADPVAIARPPAGGAAASGTGGSDDLWLIPITSIDPSPLYSPVRRVGKQVRRMFQTKHRPAQLWEPANPARFWELVEAVPLARPNPYLALMVRSDVPLHREFDAAFEAKLEALLERPLVRRLSFGAPAAVIVPANQPLPVSES